MNKAHLTILDNVTVNLLKIFSHQTKIFQTKFGIHLQNARIWSKGSVNMVKN